MDASSDGSGVSTADFEVHRDHLQGLAYRMMGSWSQAEDVVQEAWLRWCRAAEPIHTPRAWLSRAVTRLCLDELKSARMRRERYVGPWLPEPVIGDVGLTAEAATELAEDVSVALLLALERLSPLERAAFLLRKVFDHDYSEVAASLGRSESACRQLVARAQRNVRHARPRFQAEPGEHARILAAFGAAVTTGDAAALQALLTGDVVLTTDGGGNIIAALRPVHGADRVARFLLGVARKSPPTPGTEIRIEPVNGAPGLVVRAGGRVLQAVAFDIESGRIKAIYAVRNPDKLAHLT